VEVVDWEEEFVECFWRFSVDLEVILTAKKTSFLVDFNGCCGYCYAMLKIFYF